MQTPAPLEYERAASVDEAISALVKYGLGARLVAGGHSLIPMMKLRLAQPEHLIDINGLHQLDYIERSGNEVRIGALTRHVTLLNSELLWELFPVFRDAEEVIADPVVRNRGTIGGSLCQADPGEDLSAVVEALKADVVIRSADGERVVGMDGFHTGPYVTAVGAAEMLTEVRLKVRPGAGSAHQKLERRAGDFAIAASSVGIWIDGGTITDAGIALAAVGPFTIDAQKAVEHIVGKPPSQQLFAEAAEIAAQESMPSADGRGPVEYKRHLVGVLTKRALAKAASRALSGPPTHSHRPEA
jgi:aerobic carbon-monoxide dehydrogenase medium subunit